MDIKERIEVEIGKWELENGTNVDGLSEDKYNEVYKLCEERATDSMADEADKLNEEEDMKKLERTEPIGIEISVNVADKEEAEKLKRDLEDISELMTALKAIGAPEDCVRVKVR